MQLLAVNFHYIRDEKPKQGIYPRSMQEFIYQIEELGRHYDFISQSELVKILESKSLPDNKYCVLTFDDNLKEQMTAYEYLKSNSIPAIFFATTLPYIEKSVHDVHKTHHIYTVYKDAELAELLHKHFNFYDASFDEALMNDSYKYDKGLKKKIKIFLNFMLSTENRRLVIDDLFMNSINSLDDFLMGFYLDKSHLMELSDFGMLGTHTHSHSPLAILDKCAIKNEIKLSVDYLSELTGNKIRSVSYPYGRKGAVSDQVSTIAKDLGLSIGFTMNRGVNGSVDFNSPLALKRVDTNDAPGGKLNSKEFFPL